MKKIILFILITIIVGGLIFFFKEKEGNSNISPFLLEGTLLPENEIASLETDSLRFAYEAFYNHKKMSFEDFQNTIILPMTFDTAIIGESHHDITEISLAERIIGTLAKKKKIDRVFEESSLSVKGDQTIEEGLFSQHSDLLEKLHINHEVMGEGSLLATPFWPKIKNKITPGEFYILYAGRNHSSQVVRDLVNKYPGMIENYPVDNPQERPILDLALKNAGRKPLVIMFFGLNLILREADLSIKNKLDDPTGSLKQIYEDIGNNKLSLDEAVKKISQYMPQRGKFIEDNADKLVGEWKASLGLNNSIKELFFVPLGENIYAAFIPRDLDIESELDPAWSLPYQTTILLQIFNDPIYHDMILRGELLPIGRGLSHAAKPITELSGAVYYNAKEKKEIFFWVNFRTGQLTAESQGT